MESNETTWGFFDSESTTIMTSIIATPKRHITLASQIVLTFVYIFGVIGNISALMILIFKDKVINKQKIKKSNFNDEKKKGNPVLNNLIIFQRRNRKHLLMLRCLATNDLVALLGMLVQMYGTIYGAWGVTKIICSLRIVWRLFGLFSGCVAIVMAVERWLALTRPFVYQKVHMIFFIINYRAFCNPQFNGHFRESCVTRDIPPSSIPLSTTVLKLDS